jgi:hypothetical protein
LCIEDGQLNFEYGYDDTVLQLRQQLEARRGWSIRDQKFVVSNGPSNGPSGETLVEVQDEMLVRELPKQGFFRVELAKAPPAHQPTSQRNTNSTGKATAAGGASIHTGDRIPAKALEILARSGLIPTVDNTTREANADESADIHTGQSYGYEQKLDVRDAENGKDMDNKTPN